MTKATKPSAPSNTLEIDVKNALVGGMMITTMNMASRYITHKLLNSTHQCLKLRHNTSSPGRWPSNAFDFSR